MEGVSAESMLSRKDAIAANAARYFTGLPCKRGHVAQRQTKTANCVECQREFFRSPEGKASVARSRGKLEQREKAKAYSAQYHAANRDECLAKMRDRNQAYYQRNRERLIAKAVQHQRDNAAERSVYKSQWQKRKKATEPQFAAIVIMLKMIARTCDRVKMDRKQIGRTVAALGYTAEQFRQHIEAQFSDGMSWANHGTWHVDHIRPLASFDLTDERERKAANALVNLQPLWAVENMKKGLRPFAKIAAISE